MKAKTIAQKILTAKSGQEDLEPGQFITAKVDLVMANDITVPPAVGPFEATGKQKVFDPAKVVIMPDHFAPNKDVASATQCRITRKFAQDYKTVYYEVGRMGIAHVVLPEDGFLAPGMLVLGADSHTCTYGALNVMGMGVGSTDAAAAMATGKTWLKVPETIRVELTGRLSGWAAAKDVILTLIGRIGTDGARYKVLEFGGPGLASLGLEGRLTMANMATEAGAKAGLFEADQATLEFCRQAGAPVGTPFAPDRGAEYCRVVELDLSAVRPVVACPHSPANTVEVPELAGRRMDQVVIGSCTNGRLSDLAVAAEILKDRQVSKDQRTVVIPGSQKVWLAAMKAGYFEIFVNAGAAVSTPTCGPCLGGYMGILAQGESCLSTTNRNFRGRMGHAESMVYLASPATAAATAVKGTVCGPEDL